MCYLEYINAKNNLIVYRCFCCNRNYQKMFNGDLKKWFAPAFESSDNDFNQLILQSKKSIYPYEDMINDWEKLDETPLTEKKHFYGNLNMKDITSGDLGHAKTVWEEFEIKNRCNYHDLHVQRSKVLLIDVFMYFQKTKVTLEKRQT